MRGPDGGGGATPIVGRSERTRRRLPRDVAARRTFVDREPARYRSAPEAAPHGGDDPFAYVMAVCVHTVHAATRTSRSQYAVNRIVVAAPVLVAKGQDMAEYECMASDTWDPYV